MNGTYTSKEPNVIGLGEYTDIDLLAELENRGYKTQDITVLERSK